MIIQRSEIDIRSGFVEDQNRRSAPLIDYEMGSVVLNQPAADRSTHLWRAYSDGSSVWVTRNDVDEPTLVFTGSEITQIALAFDQSMRPHIAYVEGGISKFYFYETLTAQFSVMVLQDATYPRTCSDDKRSFFLGQDDVILGYMKGDSLYLRFQRERFLVEHLFAANTGKTVLIQMGMSNANRMQFRLNN